MEERLGKGTGWKLGILVMTLFVVIHSLSSVQLFVTPWTAAHQTSLSITISQSLLKLMSIESAMPSNHLILCRPFLLLPSVFPMEDYGTQNVQKADGNMTLGRPTRSLSEDFQQWRLL